MVSGVPYDAVQLDRIQDSEMPVVRIRLRFGCRTQSLDCVYKRTYATKVKVERGRLLHGAFRQHGTQTASTAAYGETAAQLCTCT